MLAALLVSMYLTVQAPAQDPESATGKAYQNAKALYDNGKVAEALAALQTFEGQYRFSMAVPQAICLQGWCWAEMQKYHEAINTFDRLRKGYPAASMIPDAILKQAECYRELKNYPTALESYREFEAKYPNDEMLPRALLGEAWTLFQQGDLASAQEIVQRARTQSADDPATVLDAQFLIAQILTNEKKYDAALRVYEQIPQDVSNARTSEGFFLAGEAMFEAGRWTDAIACYKRVQPRTSLIEHLHRQIDDLRSQQANYVQRGALPTYERQLSDLRQLQARCEAGPDLGASALFRMANCYQSLGRPEEASAAYHEFLVLHPNDKLAEQAHVRFIRELIDRRRFNEADGAAREFQTRYPTSAFANDILLLEAEALFASGKIPEALDRFQKLAASNPRLPILETADFRIADGYYTLRDFDHARDSFLAFVQQHPNSTMMPDALFRLGRCYFEISQKASDPTLARANLADAVRDYEQLRATYPSNALIPEVTFQLGYLNACAAQEGDATAKGTAAAHFEKAVASFQEFVRRWPENSLVAEALYQLARNQYALGRFDEAISSYRKLVEGFPDSTFAPLAVYEIANCYWAEDKRGEMVAQFRTFVARYPTHPRVGSALYSIASQLERDGKTDEALAAYRDVTTRAMSAVDVTTDFRKAAIASGMRVAGILEARGDVANAIAACEKILGKFRDDPAAVSAMIGQITEAYRAARKFNDAYARLDHLAAEYPQNNSVRIATITSTIELALAEGDSSRAYAAALELLGDPEKDHLPPPAYIAIGDALFRRGQLMQATQAYKNSLTLYPDDMLTGPLARLGLGESELAMNQLDDAEAIFGQIVSSTPPGALHDRAALGLAKVHLARGNSGDSRDPHNAKAIELLTAVMVGGTGENSGEAAYLLGNCYFSFGGDERGNKKTALAYYLRASLVMSGPHGEEAAFRSGQCHRALGNPQTARRAFEAYLRRFPNGLFAADAKRELESLPAQPQQS
ncbi:MAG: tetratricopeptide repeat protein [Verrucomicrobiia bacterium]|jgi:TolA-binding protein